LETNEIEVAIIDPLYLALLAGVEAKGLEASNLFDIGPLLRNVAQTCRSVGCTPILAHHSVKRLQTVGNPLELEDLAFAGIQEFARQWLLVNRREPFDPDAPGSHKLWLGVGGSAGQVGLWALDIEEGELQEDLSGRRWEVSVKAGMEVRQAAMEQKEAERDEGKQQKLQKDSSAVLKYIGDHQDGSGIVGWSRMRDGLGWDSARLGRALQPLLDKAIVEECSLEVSFGKGKRTVKGIRRKDFQHDPKSIFPVKPMDSGKPDSETGKA
jgi:hypothetical protein